MITLKGLLASTFLFLVVPSAVANTVDVAFTDTKKQCDDPPDVTLKEEVGPMPPFPAGERITVTITTPIVEDCKILEFGTNDYRIKAKNLTGHTLVDVFVVADGTEAAGGTTFGNWDGIIAGSRAKKIADVWANGENIVFSLMNVAPNVAPVFASLGVNSPAPPR